MALTPVIVCHQPLLTMATRMIMPIVSKLTVV